MALNKLFNKKKYNTYEFCPRCEANLTLQKGYRNDLPYWLCKGCNEMLINPNMETESDIVWLCDKCDSMLNIQPGFSENLKEWCCNKCGYVNKINADEVYLSEDDYKESINNPYIKMDISNVITLMDYMEVCKIDGHDNIAIVRSDNDGQLYIRKELATYDKSIYQRLLDHPIEHIPKLHHVYESNKYLVIIEDYIEGSTIEEILKNRSFTHKEALDIILKILNILRELHDSNPPIIHRDIKPSNIIITEEGDAYLLDVNVAKWYKSGETEDTRLLGTHNYAAPEQYGCGAKASTIKTDIYGLGILLNEMITGKLPKDEMATGALGAIIEKCIRMEPDLRYTDNELVDAIIDYISLEEHIKMT